MKMVQFGEKKIVKTAERQMIQAEALPKSKGISISLFNPGVDALILKAPRDFSRTDWRGFGTLVIDLENLDTDTLKVAVALRTKPGEQDEMKFVTFTAMIEPGSRAKWRIPLRQLRYSYTLGAPWGWSRQAGLGCLESCGMVDTEHIREVSISFHSPNRTGRLHLHASGAEDPKWLSVARLGLYSMELADPVKPEGWVDKYGQNSAYNFPWKVKSDSDIIRADIKEAKELAKARPFPERDQFSAWTKKPARRASGFFRTEKIDGKWWLVAPNGRLYFATGMDVVGCGGDARLDPTVLKAYSWLPPKKGDLSAAWSMHGGEGWGLSLYRANLTRKWVTEFRANYLKRAIERQLAWGFTSIGNWSDHALFRYRRLPYFSTGPGHNGIKTPYVAKLIHDAFDPRFAGETRLAAASLARMASDPWLVGHFISNEVGWNEFPIRLLEQPETVCAKRELLARLRRRYKDIWKLNRAWGACARSFTELRWPADPVRTAVAERDMADFRADFADRWYGAWSRAIRAVDPNHLVLGSRLNQGARPLDVIKASAKHNDIVSFNHYDVDIWRGEFDRYQEIANRPFFIGEYGHNSLDHGHLTAAVPVADQHARGVGYRLFTEQMAAIPYMVGGHFFQYLDEPATGRFDRETAFNGFVNVADIPYPEMVRAAKQAHARIYGIHAGRISPFSERPRL